MLVYLNGFLYNIMLQVTQREIIIFILASVIQLFLWGSGLHLFPEPVLQCLCALLGCSAAGDTTALFRAYVGSIFRVLKPVLHRHELWFWSPLQVADTCWSLPNNDKLMPALLIHLCCTQRKEYFPLFQPCSKSRCLQQLQGASSLTQPGLYCQHTAFQKVRGKVKNT